MGSNPIEGKYSKATCCCTSIGKAWGSTQVEQCPRPGTAAHRELCPRGPGFIDRKDVNECTQFPKICENGRCKNTIGGYSCRCNQGYALDENGIKCIGKFRRKRIVGRLVIFQIHLWFSFCKMEISTNVAFCLVYAVMEFAETFQDRLHAIVIPDMKTR